ncbi:hypothetical protein HOA87_08525 [bacterium]|nr:hypothetical protein [bacterium]
MKYLNYMTAGLLLASSLYAKDLPENSSWNNLRFSPKLATDNPAYSLINIGNFGYWQKSDATSAHTPSAGSGGIYPRGTAANVYLDGVLVGGYTDSDNDGAGDLLHVSGSIYTNGLVSGYIDEVGGNLTTGDDVRLYRIRKGWETLTYDQVRVDAAEMNETTVSAVSDAQIQAILDQYEEDWNNWPTHLGAPFYDLDNDGVYDPADGETPGIADADQVIWYVATDADVGATASLYGTDPIGLEMQFTLWGYNQPGAALGQIVFKNIRLINKGSKDLSEAYISLWSDPDIGDYTNDFVGVDTSTSMMFGYNGVADDGDYAAFGLAPAAVGYDFFAGPIVESAGDTAIFNLKKRPGYKNLPASSFGYFVAGGEYSDPSPYGDVTSAQRYYNLMRGFTPAIDLENPDPWLDNTGAATKFPLAGDPVTGEGDLDSSPADRRMLINAGPFVLAVGDTQDIVTALVGGIGDTYLTSVTDVKNTDLVAQTLFDDLFSSVPAAPPAPVVSATPFEDQVLLDWSGSASVQATESSNISGYAFQGYNVYQLPSATSTVGEAVRIGTFDLNDGVQTIMGNVFIPEYGQTVEIPVQYGLDKGVKRQIVISQDYLTGGPLYVGSEYYFAVSAYNYNAEPPLIEDKALETALTPIPVKLTPAGFGKTLTSAAGDGLEITHTGPGQGEVSATVTNPAQTTGDTYRVSFIADTNYVHYDGSTISGDLWRLTNETTGDVVVPFFKQAANQNDVDQPIAEGLQVVVSGPAPQTIIGIPEYASWPSSATLVDATTESHLAPSLSQTGMILDNRAGAINQPSYARDYDRFDYWGFDNVVIDFGDSSLSWEYYSGWLHTDSSDASSATYGEPVYQPFAMYRVKPFGGDTLRLFAGFWDSNNDGHWSVNSEPDPDVPGDVIFDWVNPTFGCEAWEPIYAVQGYNLDGTEISYSPDSVAKYIEAGAGQTVEGDFYDGLALSSNSSWGSSPGDIVYPFVTATLFGAYYGPNEAGSYVDGSSAGGASSLPQIGNYDKTGAQLAVNHYFSFNTAKGNTEADVFKFTSSAPLASEEKQKTDLELINVFPNPYYAANEQETGRFENFVTFTHLPDDATDVTIKIYSIDGVLVRTLSHNSATNQYAKWDLRNNNGLPIASGPYVANVKTDHGEKIVKLYIVQRNQVVQYY